MVLANSENRAKAENGDLEATNISAQDADKRPEEQEPSNKRAREDEDGADEVPAKRLDQKEEVSTDAS